MAELSGLIVTVLGLSYELTSSLYTYARSVKSAKDDVGRLGAELFALVGALEHVKRQQEQNSSADPADEDTRNPNRIMFQRVLQECLGFLQELHKSLVIPTGRLQAKMFKLRWPFQENQTRQHIQRIERVKTYFVLSLTTDEMSGVCHSFLLEKNPIKYKF